MKTYQDLFCEVPDPRVQARCLHKLSDILFIALCTLLSNGEDFEDMVVFGNQRKEWLEEFLELPNGIPSHDTFNRCLQIVDPEALTEIMQEDGAILLESLKGKLINFDGKKIKGVFPKSKGNKGLYNLNAWVSENGVCIGQVMVDDKSNEITAIPKLLSQLEIEGSTVSIDAMGCQKEVADQILEKGADYLLAVKQNQGDLHEQVEESFTFMTVEEQDFQWEYDHGRYETRRCKLLSAKEALSPDLLEKWEGIQTLVKIESERSIADVTTSHSRYYISSHGDKTAMQINAMVRCHWSIENQLHWHLDITFKEDASRARTKNAPINLNILRKIALLRINRMDDGKISLKKKRFRASLNNNYLIKALC